MKHASTVKQCATVLIAGLSSISMSVTSSFAQDAETDVKDTPFPSALFDMKPQKRENLFTWQSEQADTQGFCGSCVLTPEQIYSVIESIKARTNHYRKEYVMAGELVPLTVVDTSQRVWQKKTNLKTGQLFYKMSKTQVELLKRQADLKAAKSASMDCETDKLLAEAEAAIAKALEAIE